jgi:hypothetical protein
MYYLVRIKTNNNPLEIFCDSLDAMFKLINNLSDDEVFVEGQISTETPETVKE